MRRNRAIAPHLALTPGTGWPSSNRSWVGKRRPHDEGLTTHSIRDGRDGDEPGALVKCPRRIAGPDAEHNRGIDAGGIAEQPSQDRAAGTLPNMCGDNRYRQLGSTIFNVAIERPAGRHHANPSSAGFDMAG